MARTGSDAISASALAARQMRTPADAPSASAGALTDMALLAGRRSHDSLPRTGQPQATFDV